MVMIASNMSEQSHISIFASMTLTLASLMKMLDAMINIIIPFACPYSLSLSGQASLFRLFYNSQHFVHSDFPVLGYFFRSLERGLACGGRGFVVALDSLGELGAER
jgi:hypothetical protein